MGRASNIMAPTSCFNGQVHRLPDAPEAYGAMTTRPKAAPAQSRSTDLVRKASAADECVPTASRPRKRSHRRYRLNSNYGVRRKLLQHRRGRRQGRNRSYWAPRSSSHPSNRCAVLISKIAVDQLPHVPTSTADNPIATDVCERLPTRIPDNTLLKPSAKITRPVINWIHSRIST